MLFSQDRPNYSQYGVFHLFELLNLETSHPGATELIRNKGFSVNLSNTPSLRNAVDIIIEQTYNKHASGSSGITGFSLNPGCYSRWSVTRSMCAD
jgi:hypothetical protein